MCNLVPAEVPGSAAKGIRYLRVIMKTYTLSGSDYNHFLMVSTVFRSVILSHKVNAMWYQKVH